MVRRVRASELRQGFMVESPMRPGSFVPCRSASKSAKNGRVTVETFEGKMSLSPNQRVAVACLPVSALGSTVLKPLEELSGLFADLSKGETRAKTATVVHARTSAAAVLAEAAAKVAASKVEGSARAAAVAMSISKRLKSASSQADADDAYAAAEKWVRRAYPLMSFRVYGVTDPDNQYARLAAAMNSDDDEEPEEKPVPKGTKVDLHKCSSCGGYMTRLRPASRKGWGLYKCDYCDSEYMVRE